MTIELNGVAILLMCMITMMVVMASVMGSLHKRIKQLESEVNALRGDGR